MLSDVSAEMDEVLVDNMEQELDVWDVMEDEASDTVEQVPVVSINDTAPVNEHTPRPPHHQPNSQASSSQYVKRTGQI